MAMMLKDSVFSCQSALGGFNCFNMFHAPLLLVSRRFPILMNRIFPVGLKLLVETTEDSISHCSWYISIARGPCHCEPLDFLLKSQQHVRISSKT